MDIALPVIGAVVALPLLWVAMAYQHLLYRLPEHRVPPGWETAAIARRLSITIIGAVCVAVALRPDHYDIGPALLTAAFVLVLLVMASTDIERRLLPNRIMYPAIAAAALFVWAWPDRSVGDLLLGAGIAFAFGALLFAGGIAMGLLLRIKATPFGLGDVKLMLLMGLLAGWPAVMSALFIGIVAAGIPALVMTFLGRGRQVFAYGPFLIAGLLVVMLWPSAFV